MANAKELRAVIKAARARFDSLRDEYPELRPYLVFSCCQRWIPIEASPRQILERLPQMIVDDANKSVALETLRELKSLEQLRAQDHLDLTERIKPAQEKLVRAIDQLAYSDDVNIEIRLARLEHAVEERPEQTCVAPGRSRFRVPLATIGNLLAHPSSRPVS